MKKILSSLLVLAMILALLTACGKSESGNPTTVPTQAENDTPTTLAGENKPDDSEKEPSKPDEPKTDGLTVNMDNRGTICTTPSSLSSYQFMVGDQTYTWPVSISELVSDGWKIPDYYSPTQEFKPHVITHLYDGHLLSPDGSQVGLASIYNDSDNPAVLADMKLLGIDSTDIGNLQNFELVLPRGVTLQSTAADIWEVYGDPNHSQQFLGGSVGSNSLIYRSWNSECEIEYNFAFNADGSIHSFRVEYKLK